MIVVFYYHRIFIFCDKIKKKNVIMTCGNDMTAIQWTYGYLLDKQSVDTI
jgi:hypothetical protein